MQPKIHYWYQNTSIIISGHLNDMRNEIKKQISKKNIYFYEIKLKIKNIYSSIHFYKNVCPFINQEIKIDYI